MFDPFKRKKRNDGWQQIFEEEERRFHADILPIFQAVSQKLPYKYEYLKNRFIPELLRGCKPNPIKGSNNLYVFEIDQLSHKKYETEKNNFKIQNIKIYSNPLQNFAALELLIINNIPSGFAFSVSDWNFDLARIDTSQITEFHWDDPVYEKWVKIIDKIPEVHSKNINLKDGFEIDLDDSKYYTIYEFGNGDYIAIKNNREVYGLIHGKNLVEKIFQSPEQLYEALDKKKFDFEEYYNSRT